MMKLGLALGAAVALTGCTEMRSAMYDARQGLGIARDAQDLAGDAGAMASCPGVTTANYNKIKIGMQLSEVTRIIGCQPTEGTVGDGFATYYYGNDNRNFGVSTQNGRIATKSRGAGI